MWEQVKLAMIGSAREVCGSVRVGGKLAIRRQKNKNKKRRE